MVDLENQQTPTVIAELDLGTTAPKKQASTMYESPAITLLKAKQPKVRRKAVRYTYRRPSYLQYIDYV